MKFLVIQTRDIGDVMLSTALCNALKADDPAATVDMLTMSHCAGVVLGNPNIDSIVVLDKDKRNRVGYMLGFLARIHAARYDVVINVQGQLIGLLTCLFSLRARRIGFASFPWRLLHSERVVFRSQTEVSGLGRTIDDRFALLAPLGLKPKDRSYRIWLDSIELAAGRALLEASGLDPRKPVVALGINARDAYKRWPLEYFAQIAQWLIENFYVQIYVPHGAGEEQYSRGLKQLLPAHLQCSVCDDLRTRDIRELACVFAHCDLYFGNDSGPRHIAQSLDVPALAVVSPASCKTDWIPSADARFQALDPGDALGLGAEQWNEIRSRLTWGLDDAQWFAQLTPECARERLRAMIEELGLFVESPAATAVLLGD